MRNIDSLTNAAFRSGRRAGERRRGIATIGMTGQNPLQQAAAVDNERRENIVTSKRLSDDFKANSAAQATENPNTSVKRVQNIVSLLKLSISAG